MSLHPLPLDRTVKGYSMSNKTYSVGDIADFSISITEGYQEIKFEVCGDDGYEKVTVIYSPSDVFPTIHYRGECKPFNANSLVSVLNLLTHC